MLQTLKSNPRFLWAPLGIGVLALVVGFYVFFNSNEGFPGGLLQGNNEEKPQNMKAALEEIGTRLVALQTRLETEEVSEDMIERVVMMRSDWGLVAEYISSEEQEMWRMIDQGLQDVEHTLRSKLEAEL